MADKIREKLGYQKDEATSKQDDVEMSDNQNPQEQKPKFNMQSEVLSLVDKEPWINF